MDKLSLCEPYIDRVVTVIEPHHDDLCLDVLGTLITKDRRNELDKIKVLSVFGNGRGVSVVPTKLLGRFFSCEFEVKECWLESLFPSWVRKKGREEIKKYVEAGGTVERRFKEVNGSWKDFKTMAEAFYEGTILLPQGLCHADHYLLARLKGDLWYREYPYWWQDMKKHLNSGQGLFELYEYGTAGQVILEPEIWLAKWRIFAVTYMDVLASFNPRFGKPYYRNVRDELFFVRLGGDGVKAPL